MQGIASEIEAQGATLVAVTPQSAEHTKMQMEKDPLNFDVVTDVKNAFAEQLRIKFKLPDYLIPVYQAGVDLPAINGDDSWTLPMPARFVVDEKGIVRFAEANPDYTRRPEPSETLEVLRSI